MGVTAPEDKRGGLVHAGLGRVLTSLELKLRVIPIREDERLGRDNL